MSYSSSSPSQYHSIENFFSHCSDYHNQGSCDQDNKCNWNNDKCDKVEGFNHNESVSDKGASDKVASDKGASDKEAFDKGSSDKGASDKGASDKNSNTALSDNRNANYLRNVYLLHILLVAPLMIYIGCISQKHDTLHPILEVMSYVVVLFFGLSLLKSEMTGNWNWKLSSILNYKESEDPKNSKRLRLVYLLHLLIIAPILYYACQKGKNNQQVLGMLCILGILALFYHGYSYWRSETTGQWNWSF